MAENTILDAFISVGLDPDSPITGQVNALAERLKGIFGTGGTEAGAAFDKGLAKSAARSGGRMAKQTRALNRELNRFRRDAGLVDIEVRLRGNEDIGRELRRVRSLVNVERENFKDAAKGKEGDADRIAAVREIIRLREIELSIVNERVQAESAQRGQPSASKDLVNQLKAAAVQGANLRAMMSEVRGLVSGAKNKQLAEDLRTARIEGQRLSEVLKLQVRDRDLIGAQKTIQQMRLVRSEFERLKTELTTAINLNVSAPRKSNQSNQLSQLNNEVEKFRRDADIVEIDVRLRGNEDVTRELAKLRKLVNIERRRFTTAESGQAGDATRAAALQEIVRLREKELTLVAARAQAESAERGQPAASKDLVNQLRAASIEGSNLREAMSDIGSLVTAASNSELAEQFRDARREGERLAKELDRAVRDRDLIGAQEAIQKIKLVRVEFDRLRGELTKSIDLNVNAAALAREFRFESQRRKIRLREQQSLSRGSLSGTDRAEMVRLNALLDQAILNFNKLNSEAIKTPKIISDMRDAMQDFDNAADSMEELNFKTQGANVSMNTLQNNMYQAGQAIEDFAVGFDLNGLRGGIRGAANNVSFLLNQLALSAAQSGKMSSGFSKMVPLLGGIGGAVAVLVIPRLVDWVRSLDEVEIKTKDISDLINRTFERAEFEVSLKLNRQSFQNAVKDAETLGDALQEIIDVQKNAANLRVEIQDILGGAAGEGARKLISQTLDEMQQVAEKSGEELGKKLKIKISQAVGPVIAKSNFSREELIKIAGDGAAELTKAFEDFDKFNNQFIKGTGEAKIGLLALRQQAKDGLGLDPATINKTIDLMNSVVDNFDELEETMENSEGIQHFKSNIEAFIPKLEQLREKAEEAADQIDAINSSALQQAIIRAGKLTDEYEFLQEIVAGRKTEEDRILFDHQQQTKELERQLDLIEQQTKASGGNQATVDQLKADARSNLLKQQGLDLQIRTMEVDKENAEASKEANQNALDLAEKYQFLIDVAAGRRTEEELILLTQRQQDRALQNQLATMEKLSKEKGGTQAAIDQRKADQLAERSLERQVELQTRINQIREKLKEVDKPGESQRLSADQAVIGVVSNVNKEEEQRQKLIRELEILTAAVNENSSVLRGETAAKSEPRKGSALDSVVNDVVRGAVGRFLKPGSAFETSEFGVPPSSWFQEFAQEFASGIFDFDRLNEDRRVGLVDEAEFNRLMEMARNFIARQNADQPAPSLQERNTIADIDRGGKIFDERRAIAERNAAKEEEIKALRKEIEERNAARGIFTDSKEDAQKGTQEKVSEAVKAGITNADFSSETMEKLLATSNEILTRLDQNVTKLDTRARAS